MEQFFSFNISWRHQKKKKKKKHRHAYLISFSTGSHKRNCQDTFRKVSIKSKSYGGGHFMSDSKLLPDLKGSAVYLCKAANVLFYSLVTARMERDRSTGTLSAAVAPQWQTAAIILHVRRFYGCWKRCERKNKIHAASLTDRAERSKHGLFKTKDCPDNVE